MEGAETRVKKAKHDYHTFVFSTIHNGEPESRTVVLRAQDKNKFQIWFHTDKRSQKSPDQKT